jgi:iron(III) transport system permease protein
MRKLGSGPTFSMRMADRQPGFALPGGVAAVAGSAALFFTLAQLLLYGLILWGSVSVTWGVNFSFTLDHLHALLDFRQSSILRSLGCALTAACGGSLLGMVCAGLLRHTAPLRRQWAESLLTLPYILPGTFFGLGYLLAFSRLPFDISASALIAFNCMFRQLAPSLKAGTAGVSSIDPALEKAVRDLGGGPSAYFKDVLIPLLRPSALFAFVNAFSASMISTGPIIFLVTPYAKVMSVDMFESINSGSFGEANAMAVALIGLVLTMEGIVFLIDRLWRRHARV